MICTQKGSSSCFSNWTQNERARIVPSLHLVLAAAKKPNSRSFLVPDEIRNNFVKGCEKGHTYWNSIEMGTEILEGHPSFQCWVYLPEWSHWAFPNSVTWTQISVLQLETLNQSELASRLTLNCQNSYVEPHKIKDVAVTIIDVSDHLFPLVQTRSIPDCFCSTQLTHDLCACCEGFWSECPVAGGQGGNVQAVSQCQTSSSENGRKLSVPVQECWSQPLHTGKSSLSCCFCTHLMFVPIYVLSLDCTLDSVMRPSELIKLPRQHKACMGVFILCASPGLCIYSVESIE